MKTRIKVLDKEFEIKSRLKEEGVNFPISNDNLQHNKFTISISRIIDNKRITRRFYFYDSFNNYRKGITDLDEDTLKWVFRHILEDGLLGCYTFSEFCKELGLNEDSITALRSHQACQKTLIKLLGLGILLGELTDIINELSKMGIE